MNIPNYERKHELGFILKACNISDFYKTKTLYLVFLVIVISTIYNSHSYNGKVYLLVLSKLKDKHYESNMTGKTRCKASP